MDVPNIKRNDYQVSSDFLTNVGSDVSVGV